MAQQPTETNSPGPVTVSPGTPAPEWRRHPAAARWVAMGGLLTALVVALMGLRAPGEPAAATLSRALEDPLRAQEVALRRRLTELAALPRLAAAVSTDVATVRDLTADELPLQPRPGEIIAVGQLPRRGPRVVLRVEPAGALAPPLELAGPRARIRGGQLVVCDAVRVKPLERADELDGVVAACWAVDTVALVDQVRAARAAAWIEGDGAAVKLIDAPGASAGRRLAVSPQHPPARSLRLVLAVPGRPATPFVAAGALALVSIGLSLGLVWLRGRRFTVGPLGAPAPGLPAQPGTTPEPAASPLASTPSPAYGTPFTTAYGTPSSPAYGTPPTPAYGTPFPGHATPSPAYGTPPTPAYGTPLPAYATPSPSFATPSPVSGTMPLPAASQPGDPGRMDRYEIVRLLDAGGSAEVYLARVAGEPGFEKLVALKVLQSALAREPEVVERFLEEARLASRLDHPNIVQVLDVGRSRDQYFIAMEYVDGADLDRLRSISRRAGKLIPVSVVLAILRRICDGLHAAHGASAADGTPLGLIHRDVKSANVMVGRSGVVKIGDFGIAQASRALDRRRTDVGGKVKGTVGYMAPEQRQGHMLDSRTDIFGVGAIAYELLSGAALDLDPLALGPQGWPHLRRPSTLRRDMPLELDEVVMRALAYDREQRWPSCAVLESSLERIATWHPPIATDKTVGAWARELLALSL